MKALVLAHVKCYTGVSSPGGELLLLSFSPLPVFSTVATLVVLLE